MMFFIKTILISAITSSLIACAHSNATVSILPQGDDRYTAIATSTSESDARNGAVSRAEKTCKRLHRRFIVLSEQTVYQGIDQTLGQVSQMARHFLKQNEGYDIGSAQSDTDYKTTLVFSCQSD